MKFNKQILALAWVLLLISTLLYVCQWMSTNRPDFDLVDLLPQNQAVTYEEKLLQGKLANEHKDTIILAIALPNKSQDTIKLIDGTVKAWKNKFPFLSSINSEKSQESIVSVVKHISQRQITQTDELFLRSASVESLYEKATVKATSAFTVSFFPFSTDPFGFKDSWIRERLSQWRADLQDGVLIFEYADIPYALYFMHADNQKVMQDPSQTLEAIDDLTKSITDLKQHFSLVASGLPLFSAAAAQQAQQEIKNLGILSSLGIVLIAWFWFGNLRSLAVIVAVCAQAFLIAVASTILCLGKIHLITLVFGTTLIGITVDYSAHYLCSRLNNSENSADSIKRLIPSLSLALISTVIGFALMATTPFPGLTQIAIFCISGITAAYIAVVLWLPVLVNQPLSFPTRLKKLTLRLNSFPAFESLSFKQLFVVVILFVSVLIAGFSQLNLKTSLYDLNTPPKNLLHNAAVTSSMLNAPSISQYFLIKADNVEELLEREEQLERNFLELNLPNIKLISAADWIMSKKRQENVQALYENKCESVSTLFREMLGAPLTCEKISNLNSVNSLHKLSSENVLPPILIQDNDVEALVLITGLKNSEIDTLRTLEDQSNGIYFRNYPQQISDLLSQYCLRIAVLLVAAVFCSIVLLTIRFKKDAWRAYCPCVFGILLTIALLGLTEEGLSLFSLSACVLLLGLGLDYGIFLTSNPQGSLRTVAAITFAALTTLLSFGLLAFSSTPALKSFGLCVMYGQFFIWCLTPAFRKVNKHEKTPL